eukprot:3451203-Pleurochrysis_carterae.AAC.1
MADAVSRSDWRRFQDLCAQLPVRPEQWDAPAACVAVLDAVLHRAKRSGKPVALSSFRPPAEAMP